MNVNDYWWTAMGLGVIIIVAAMVLLQMLLDQVHRVESVTEEVLEAAGQVAGNTINSGKFLITSAGLDALTEEALRHDAFLHAVLAKTGS